MPKQVFRQAALDRLSAPEELDKMVQVTDRRGWIALIALISLVVAAIVWSIFGSLPVMMKANGVLFREDGVEEIFAPQNGQISDLKVKTGDSVKAGQIVAVFKSGQGSSVDITAPTAGTVLDTPVRKDSAVESGTTLLKIELTSKPLKGMILLPLVEGKRLQQGAKVQITPSNVRSQEHGYLMGKVVAVSPYPATSESLFDQLKSRELVQMLSSGGAVIRADVELEKDSGTVSGFKWSTPKGPPYQMTGATLFSANLVVGEQRPISLVLPIFGDEGR